MQPQLGQNMQMAGQPMTMNAMPQNMQYQGAINMGQPQIMSQGMPGTMMMGGAQGMPMSYTGMDQYSQNYLGGNYAQLGKAGMMPIQGAGTYSSYPQIQGAQVMGQPRVISSQVVGAGGYSQAGAYPQVQGAQLYSEGAYTGGGQIYGQTQMLGQPQIMGQQAMMGQGYSISSQQMAGQPQIMQGAPQMMQGNYPPQYQLK